MQPIDEGEFKARCDEVLDRVAATEESVVILRGGKPIAELSPAVRPGAAYPQHELKGTVTEVGDIVPPVLPAGDWKSTRD